VRPSAARRTVHVSTLANHLRSPEPTTSDEVLEHFLARVADAGLTLLPAQEEAIREFSAGRHRVFST